MVIMGSKKYVSAIFSNESILQLATPEGITTASQGNTWTSWSGGIDLGFPCNSEVPGPRNYAYIISVYSVAPRNTQSIMVAVSPGRFLVASSPGRLGPIRI